MLETSQLHKFPSNHRSIISMCSHRKDVQRLNFQSIFLPGSIQGVLERSSQWRDYLRMILFYVVERKMEN